MTNASGSRHSMAQVVEVTPGVTPATPVFKAVRHNTTNIALSRSTIQSAELRSDRQIADVRGGNYQIGGDIVSDLSFGSFDDQLEAVLCGTWAPSATMTASTLSAAAADNSINDSADGFITAGFKVGQRVNITGFTGDVANNITNGVISSVAAGKIVIAAPEGNAIVDDAAGEAVTITTVEKSLKGGLTRRSFTIERYFADIDQFLRYVGCEYDKFSLSVKPNAMAAQTLSVVGRSADAATPTEIVGATYDPATTSSAMDSFSGEIKENGSTISVVTEIKLDVVNSLSAMFVVGQKGAADVSIGRFQVSASISAYFDSVALLNKFINETESDLYFETVGAEGKYRWTLPRIKYTGGQPDVGGEGPVVLTMPIQALYDAATGSSLLVEKIPA